MKNTSMDVSTSRMKKNSSLTNVTRPIRRSPRLKLNTPKRSISSNLRTYQNIGQSTGSGAFVSKKNGPSKDGKESSKCDKSVAFEPLTCEATTKKMNLNATYSKPLVSERLHSPRKKQVISVKESIKKNNSSRSIRRSPRMKLNTSLKKPKRNISVNLKTSQKVRQRTGSGAFVSKKNEPNADRKEYSKDDESSVSELLTRESPTKKRNLNDTYNASLLPEKWKSSRQKTTPTKDMENNDGVKYSTHPHFGRRTGSAAFEGKKIRLLPDGTENYEDYWTDELSSEASDVTESSFAKSSITLGEAFLNNSNEAEKVMFDKVCKTYRNVDVSDMSSVSTTGKKNTSLQHSRSSNYTFKRIVKEPSCDLSQSVLSSIHSPIETSLNGSRTNKAKLKLFQNKMSRIGSKIIDHFKTVSSSSPNRHYSQSMIYQNKEQSKSISDVPEKTTPTKDMGNNDGVRYSTHRHFGRRTGSAAFEGKKIRLLSDGTENYEDYWTDEASSEASYKSESSLTKSSIACSGASFNKSNEAKVDNTCSVSIESEKDKTVQHCHSANHIPISSELSFSKSPNKVNPSKGKHSLNEYVDEPVSEGNAPKLVIEDCGASENHGPFSSELSLSKSPNKVNLTTGKHSLNELDANVTVHEGNALRVRKIKRINKDCSTSENARVDDTSSVSIKSEKDKTVQHSHSANHGPISSELSILKSPIMVNLTTSKHSLNELDANKTVPEGNASRVRKIKRINKDCSTSENAMIDDTSSVSIESEKDKTLQHSHSTNHGPISGELSMSKSPNKVNPTTGKHSLNELDANEIVPEGNALRVRKKKHVNKDCGTSENAGVDGTSSVSIESEKDKTGQHSHSTNHGPISSELSMSNKVNPTTGKHSLNKLDAIKMVPEGNAQRSRKKKRVNKISQQPLRRTARVPVPPLAYWHGERRKFRIVCNELLYVGIDSGWKSDDRAISALTRRINKNNNKFKKLKKTNCKRLPKTTVLTPHTREYVDVDLHRPFNSVQWSAIGGKDETKGPYYLTKTFSSENMAFGFLNICPLEVKSSQYSPKDNIHFVVQKGQVKVTIHETTFKFEKYDSFIVPSTVAYCIENLRNSNALLSFSSFQVPFFPYQCK